MTKPLAQATGQRPRRRPGDVLRTVLLCPLCGTVSFMGVAVPAKGSLRVVAYRRRSVRLECRQCRLRFSLDTAQVTDLLNRIAALDPAIPGLPPNLMYAAQAIGAVASRTKPVRWTDVLISFATDHDKDRASTRP